MIPISLDAYQLAHDGTLALADIETTGIRVDAPYLKSQYVQLSKDLLAVERALWKTREAKEWKARYKDKTLFSSNAQLSTMLFNVWRYKPTKATRKGNAAVDYDVLRKIGTPFTKGILQMRKILKVRDTYILGLLKCQTSGLLHPSFNLHMVVSHRSSSENPNFQNQPVRDPFQGDIVRRAFLPLEPGHQFGEIDYKGNEVVSNVCYSRDPNLISYIKDPSKDMHRDAAMDCFMLRADQVGKKIRYVGKNSFTFAEFYGSYYANVAPAMWEAIGEYDLTTEDGIPLYTHLKSKGITDLAEFTDHIQQVEDRFWNERFPTHAEWKRKWYADYLGCGWFDLLTGFRCQGPMRRNEACNYPGQGTGFHFVLWDVVQLHRWLTDNKMRTKIIGQIHDSIEFSFHPAELQTVLQKARQMMTISIREHWPWICVPMTIEAEVAPAGGTWRDKQQMEIPS